MTQIILDNNISTWYYITEDGKCYNSKTGKYLKGQENSVNGYFSYNITLPDGSKKRLSAHRLVAIAYVEGRSDIKKEVNHKDGNKLNNCADNLEWVSPKENQRYALNTELRKFNHVYCFNKEKQLVAEYKNIPEAARAIGINPNLIQQEIHKNPKALSGGFYWNDSKQLGDIIIYQNLGKAKEVFQYDLNGKFINSYKSTGEAARSLGISNSSHIGECCRGKIKTYKGFVWRYSEDIVSPSDENQRK